MPVPANFQFSQGSLQDFVDCPRRFFLRYILRLAWPAVEAEPALENERLMLQGARFHSLVNQSLLGIPGESLDRMVADPDLALWWQSLQSTLPGLKSSAAAMFPEVNLRAALAGFTLAARSDLVVRRKDDRLQIIDWKTSQRRTRRDRLAARLQTQVYPYLLVRDGARLNGGRPVQPEQVEMVYWFARFPGQPERFVYSPELYQAGEAHLAALIEHIAGLEDPEFVLDAQICEARFCVYRSFCEQGVRAGNLDAGEEEEMNAGALAPDFDFEQIAELEF